MTPKFFINLLKDTLKEWGEDQGSRLAAALAYYTTFSIAPLLAIVIALAGLLGGREAAHGLVMAQVEDLTGAQGREFVQSMIETAAEPTTGAMASIIGAGVLILGALGVFNEMQNALNTIWDVEPKPIKELGPRIWSFISKRLLSFSLLVGIGFLLLVSLVVSAGLSALSDYIRGFPVFSEIMIQVLNIIISLGIITVLFAMIFKFVPDVEVTWRNVWLGAAITAIFFTIGKTLIGLYLGRSNVGATFGAAGSLVLIMVWVYYSSQILFLGAEFTQVYSKMTSPKPPPSEHAEPLPENDKKKKPGSEEPEHIDTLETSRLKRTYRSLGFYSKDREY
ncbi:MAG TPA: YihY/virulence factor BrkB family protein, partial [Anaerolineales bacterium]|nr:YihY/virulence factor BrkB family protein [Anaerolineales bacterium]